jgi:hypothetical protein
VRRVFVLGVWRERGCLYLPKSLFINTSDLKARGPAAGLIAKGSTVKRSSYSSVSLLTY